MYDLIIVGGGLAGITAAIYAARKDMNFIIISPEFGGEIANTPTVENWPGIKSINGIELAENYVEHMKSLNVKIVENFVTEVKKQDDNFIVNTYEGTYESKTIIWATGSRYRELKVPGEEQFKGRGVTYCSTCDGPLYKNKMVAVVGAGNNGLTSAIYMANIAKKVYLLNKNPQLKGDPILAEKLLNNPKVEIMNNTRVKEIKGDKKVTSLITMDDKEIVVDGVIINVGYVPITDPIKDIVELDSSGYVAVDNKNMTKVPGFFATGDVVNNPYKQLVISASDGCKAALGVFDYLSMKK
ncbi:TPA: FAD-dependent oxidoreductase [Candidatus Woesearchaeota archaeon]|nr:FAD-dependent oxidoreductase [Candidatus Woesearchaeota archaeon]HIH32320.1 FAD-dependent oxidoreductase [Candidatus Woesearchaeota archaeon]HIH55252.1 FAD-dependent oxidoreductase [Candidatus Woesearchaeota archaeon]HIJ01964.1 FAD-dependent oxidoreductase [Candidatus Woesearchaeota archaeon]HIJ13916.1 FAD-dependent oxidoreductase [Candidatus Woesearchaeota archaeon]